MSTTALLLVLTAALLHASWNFVLKKSGGGLGILTLSAIIGSSILTPVGLFLMFAQKYAFTWAAFGMIAGSAVIHLAYFLLLDRAYRGTGGAGGNLSVVYPLARATGPLLTIVAATLFFGERMTPIAMGGAVLILISAMVLTGDPRKIFSKENGGAAGFALLCGCTIAAYTVWDKQAVAWLLIPPVIFDWGAGLARCLMLTPLTMKREPGAIAKAWRTHRRTAIAIGVMSPLSYILVLTAMVNTPVSYVAPAREVSILFAALLGAHVLNEGDAAKRTMAALGMVLGISALAIG
ncbi:MAG: EamA family transporter [Betaproteobacteria bacterium]|nr:EamA family transporter [Betaproteobacteria bacterium]